MRIVKDVSELPKLFEIPLGLFEMPLEWGMIITDNQMIVFAQETEEEWEGHNENALELLKEAFPNASLDKLMHIFGNRMVFVVCDPLLELIVYIPEDSNLSRPQSDCLLKYLEDMKHENAIKNIEISFYDGCKKGIECSLEELLELVTLKQPQFSELDSSEKFIGIPIEEYLCDNKKKKPRT